MTSTAILIGNANYRQGSILPCCLEDVAAMRTLIEATDRYDVIREFTDLDGDGLRDVLRQAFPEATPQNEVFFYYSGHGAQVGAEFFYCGVGFDPTRPNETGMSHTQLHDLLRTAEPKLLVKVIDACYSGTRLVKTEPAPLPVLKDGFQHVLQFSSSQDDQASMAGEPLSAFTSAFLAASVRKTEGAIYYTDLANTLRDDFIGNDDQTPYFVSQSTGREILVDDAGKLAPVRTAIEERWSGKLPAISDDVADVGTVAAEPPAPVPFKDRLLAAEGRMADAATARALIDRLFDGVVSRFSDGEFGDFFDVATVSHPDFQEVTAEAFIIRVMSKEPRRDRLVTAEKRPTKTTRPAWMSEMQAALVQMNPNWTENYDLNLNCVLDRAQLRLTLTPKYRALQQLVLVLTCAPSLERCYVFEITTQHLRADWDAFDDAGREIVRRWYKVNWDDPGEWLVKRVCDSLEAAVREHLEETSLRLTKDD